MRKAAPLTTGEDAVGLVGELSLPVATVGAACIGSETKMTVRQSATSGAELATFSQCVPLRDLGPDVTRIQTEARVPGRP